MHAQAAASNIHVRTCSLTDIQISHLQIVRSTETDIILYICMTMIMSTVFIMYNILSCLIFYVNERCKRVLLEWVWYIHTIAWETSGTLNIPYLWLIQEVVSVWLAWVVRFNDWYIVSIFAKLHPMTLVSYCVCLCVCACVCVCVCVYLVHNSIYTPISYSYIPILQPITNWMLQGDQYKSRKSNIAVSLINIVWTHTHTHTHTCSEFEGVDRERERERERETLLLSFRSRVQTKIKILAGHCDQPKSNLIGIGWTILYLKEYHGYIELQCWSDKW